ncbi:hypothetical protein [Burkholderia cenocepacia]|uniref:hypothetical protein n=1 Tax=Burkholderia cenocepacia TaxID=95486 RepID=UPI00222FC4EC|nr:hypothetical protein [Burkholderia cenocepacia]MCW3675435.1 hypothetical protein [Burkholderia cenocepacia]
MSDLMLLGILRMPDASIAGDCAGFMQFVSAARGAADRIESDAKIIEQLRAELEAAAADTDRLDWIMRELSGKALRQISVVYSDASLPEFRRAIDAALAQRQGEGS